MVQICDVWWRQKQQPQQKAVAAGACQQHAHRDRKPTERATKAAAKAALAETAAKTAGSRSRGSGTISTRLQLIASRVHMPKTS